MQPLSAATRLPADGPEPARPFLGPISFKEDDRELFFGREADIVRLRSLLRTERIVVLHSPSGAGKTSLIQAGLIPRLREDGFRVFPVVRVGEPLPDPKRAPASANRYAYSAVQSLEAGFAADCQLHGGYKSAEDLIGIRLSTYFEHRSAVHEQGSSARLLIFDQFEELFTRAPHDHKARIEFFTDLAKVLRDRTVWALFVMREEHVAALDRYKRLLPAQLAARFHLDLLTVGAARAAISKPLARSGVEIHPEALESIIDDLARRVDDQGVDAEPDDRPAPDAAVIDPLHLQLLCVELWDRLPAGVRKVDAKLTGRRHAAVAPEAGDLSAVEWALLNYYDRTLQRVCEKALQIQPPGADEPKADRDDAADPDATNRRQDLERRTRTWIDDRLIERDLYRRQEMAEKDPLVRKVQELLEDEHILRASVRLGITWYEIAHDRMVAPIRRSNEAWYDRHHNRFERNARRWRRQHFPRQFEALTRRELEDEGYGNGLSPETREQLPEHERRYLEYCLEQGRRKRRSVILGVAAGVAGALLISPVFVAKIKSLTNQFFQLAESMIKLEKERNAIASRSLGLHLQSQVMTQRWRDDNHDVALLLAKLAADEANSAATEPGAEGAALDTMFWTALEAAPFSQTVPREVLGGKATSLAAWDQGVQVAVPERSDGRVARIDVDAHRLTFERPCRHGVQTLSPDRRLTAVIEGSRLEIVAVGDGQCETLESKSSGATPFRAVAPVWSPDRRYVAALLDDRGAAVYRVGSGSRPVRKIQPRRWALAERGESVEHPIEAVAFGDGVFAAGDGGGGVQLIDLADLSARAVGFSVWQEDEYWPESSTTGYRDPSHGHAGVLALGFLPLLPGAADLASAIDEGLGDGRGWLCIVHRGGFKTRGGRVFLYSLDDPHRHRYELVGDESSMIREVVLREMGRLDDRPSGERFTSARFSNNLSWLVTGGSSGTVIRWDLRNLRVEEVAISSLRYPFSPAQVGDAPEPVSTVLVVPAAREVFRGARGTVRAIEVTEDGQHVAAIEKDDRVRLWHSRRPAQAYQAENWRENSFVYDLAFDSEEHLITSDNRGRLQGWSVSPSADGGCPGGASENGRLGLCVAPDGTPDTVLPPARGETVSIRSIDAFQGLLVLGTADFVPRVLETVKPGRQLSLIDSTVKHTAGLSSAVLRPRNPGLQMRYDVATADAAGGLLLWGLEYQPGGAFALDEPAIKLALAGEGKSSLAVHPEGRWLAAATRTGGLQLFDLEGKACVDQASASVEPLPPCVASRPVGSSEGILAIAFSPDGGHLATAGEGVALWRFTADPDRPALERDPIQPLGAAGPTLAVVFHPGGRRLLAATDGSSVLLWRLDRPRRPTVLRSEGTELQSVAFSPEGGFLAAGDGRGRFMVWDMEPARLACRLTLRNLTQREWKDLGLEELKWRQICEGLPPEAG